MQCSKMAPLLPLAPLKISGTASDMDNLNIVLWPERSARRDGTDFIAPTPGAWPCQQRTVVDTAIDDLAVAALLRLRVGKSDRGLCGQRFYQALDVGRTIGGRPTG